MVSSLLSITEIEIIYNSAELGILGFYNNFAENFANCFGTFFVKGLMQ